MTGHLPPYVAASDPALVSSPRVSDVIERLTFLAATIVLDEAQDATRATMLAFAREHGDALERACPPGHFTGSALVIDAVAERTLVLFHRKLQRWLQPGGHADGDANLAGVALKEATEETGIAGLRVDPRPIDLDIHEVSPPREPTHRHLDVRYLVIAPPDAVEQGNHESEGLRWVTLDELEALGVDRGTLRMARAGFARARA